MTATGRWCDQTGSRVAPRKTFEVPAQVLFIGLLKAKRDPAMIGVDPVNLHNLPCAVGQKTRNPAPFDGSIALNLRS
jgi:hypothetical protein